MWSCWSTCVKNDEKSWVFMISRGSVRNLGVHLIPPQVMCRPTPAHGKTRRYAMHVHRHTVKRVAIVDFDVHHGNGTQACVQRLGQRSVTHRSSHTKPCHPRHFETMEDGRNGVIGSFGAQNIILCVWRSTTSVSDSFRCQDSVDHNLRLSFLPPSIEPKMGSIGLWG